MELEDSPGADKYQKIKQLAVIVKPAYTDPKVKEYLRDLWSNTENRATDDQLRDACLGRDVPRLVLMDMVRRAERQYRQAEQAGSGGGDAGAADSGFNGDLASGVDALLDEGPKNEEALAVRVQAADGTGTRGRMRRRQRPVLAGGGLDEFADPTDADIDRLPPGADDPFGDETSPATGATTTGTSAPAAEKVSRTAPKSAGECRKLL